MNIPTIQFIYDRKHLASKDRQGVVELRITYQRVRKHLSTGIKCYPAQWDARNECIRSSLQAIEYNVILAELKKKALRIVSDMVAEGSIDLSAIPVLLKQKNVDMTFIDYVYKRMNAKQVTENTHRTYRTIHKKLIEYGKIKFFSDITQKNIRAFSEWLHAYSWKELDKNGVKVRRKYSQATIYKLTSNLSLFISDAVVDGYLKENPYVTKRMSEDRGGTRIDEYLTKEEVAQIEQAAMPLASIAIAKDLFLLQCYSGLAYSDLMSYDFSKHKKTRGQELCSGKRQKTGAEYFFILTEKSRQILRKYSYEIPKLSNQPYNAKLKLMAEAAHIDKHITSHVGRRTAGSMWLNSGIPIEVVSKCLGHSSVLMTQKAYAKILDTTIVDAFKKANEMAKKKP